MTNVRRLKRLNTQQTSVVKQDAAAEDDEQGTPALFIQNRLLQSPPFVRLMTQTPCVAQPGEQVIDFCL